jgi:hypothetical protein
VGREEGKRRTRRHSDKVGTRCSDSRKRTAPFGFAQDKQEWLCHKEPERSLVAMLLRIEILAGFKRSLGSRWSFGTDTLCLVSG